MNNVYIRPYKSGSRSATALSLAIEAKMIRLKGSRFIPSPKKTVINWGSSTLPEELLVCNVLNNPRAVRRASHKLDFFREMSEGDDQPRIPRWTLDKEIAKGWLAEREGKTVFARTVLQGHSGEGIVQCSTPAEVDAIPNNTLLVDYVPKREEYRVHLTRKGVFLVQKKVQRKENIAAAAAARAQEPRALRFGDPELKAEDEVKIDWKVRNLSNGFIFARNDGVNPPADVLAQAQKAFAKTDLDFGAVDVIFVQKTKEAWVLEVNTSPGLEGSTVEDYANAIKGLVA